MWLDHLPASVAFCDVETTGLGKHDRVVSFGGIGMISRNLMKGAGDLKYVYLVFDPGMGNCSGAARIHGFSDSTLRLQDPFTRHAAMVRRFLTSHELLVAHNAAFDLRFINREMSFSNLAPLTRPVYCTMKGYRALGLGGSASLSAVCHHVKLARAGDLHDAIEDAWLAMQIYLWLHGCPLQCRLRGSLPRAPSNLRHSASGVDRPGPISSGMSVEEGDYVKGISNNVGSRRDGDCGHGRQTARGEAARGTGRAYGDRGGFG
jgi:DNA polymerase III subunit epsilon